MKSLPYTTTKTYTLNGQPYTDEKAVLRAAVEKALGNPGVTTSVLQACCALAPLLARACELGMGMQPPAPDKED